MRASLPLVWMLRALTVLSVSAGRRLFFLLKLFQNQE